MYMILCFISEKIESQNHMRAIGSAFAGRISNEKTIVVVDFFV